jgi:aerobic carbon-monoxide dehydrogenase large subunit
MELAKKQREAEPRQLSARPSQIGRSIPRQATRRLVAGRGSYIDDIQVAGMLHAAFLRSPHGNAGFRIVDCERAASLAGVVRVLTAEDLADVVQGWQGVSRRFPSLVSPTQYALANGRATFQGEPVALVIAESRAIAEDAVGLIAVDWDERPACANLRTAAEACSPVIYPEFGTNVAFEHNVLSGDVDAMFAAADCIVEEEFAFARHTGVPLETRGIIASFEPGEGKLTIWHSTQVPNQTKVYMAAFLNLPSHHVRVVVPDVGGGFGIKMHIYSDEVAICAASKFIGRPIKFICDRLEALGSDIQARDHIVRAKMSVDARGRIQAFDIDDLFGLGAYSSAPRTGVMEPMGVLRMIGAPYGFAGYRARLRACFLNKAPSAQYRAVGHPIAVAVTERLLDKAAYRLGLDPLELRARNYLEPGSRRTATPAGATIFDVSHAKCRDTMVSLMMLGDLRNEQARLRAQGRYRGIGFAVYVEMTATGPGQYGNMGVSISAMDTSTVSLEASGAVVCTTTIVEIGQGTSGSLAQIVAEAIGIAAEQVVVHSGDTESSGPGGGVWASRGMAGGGETAWKAARRLRSNVLQAAGALLQMSEEELDIRDGEIVDISAGLKRMSLSELAQIAFYRTGEFPSGYAPQLSVSEQHHREKDLTLPTNGIQASYVEVDHRTGLIKLLRHWVVDDCGTVVNPLLLDEQIRGGVVQGIGAALYEHSAYDEDAQFLAGSFADYRLPLASEMPDIEIGHVSTPYAGSELGIKGGGEAGTCAAGAAVLNAVNDALRSLGAEISQMPILPRTVLTALENAKA